MNTKRLSAFGIVILLAFSFLAAQGYAQNVTHTPWQVYEGAAPLAYKTTGEEPPEVVFRKVFDEYEDRIPGENADWKLAGVDRDGEVYHSFERMPTCGTQVEFVYFQTVVDIPPGYTVDDFEISYETANDAARTYFFKGGESRGRYNKDADLIRAVSANQATDLKDQVGPGKNRVVIAAFNQCHGGEVLGIKLTANGTELAQTEAVDSGSSAGESECFRLRATATDDQYLSYIESRIEANGRTPARLLSSRESGEYVPLHVALVDVAPGKTALKALNYPRPEGADVAGKEPFLISADNGQMWIEYLPKERAGRGHMAQIGALGRGGSPGQTTSFESAWDPKTGWHLRHQSSYAKLHPTSDPSYSKEDATWIKDSCAETENATISAGKAFNMLAYSINAGTAQEKSHGEIQYHLGYHPSKVNSGKAPVKILTELGTDSKLFDITPVKVAPMTYAFRVDNYPAPEGVDTSGETAYLLNEGGNVSVQYVSEGESDVRSQFVDMSPLYASADAAQFRSFESKAQPGSFLRHQNYNVYVQKPDGSDLFKQDATWRIEDAE